MATNRRKSTRSRGRPNREETVRRALAELGTDPALVDPRRILASICADVDAPAGARVAAARTLLGLPENPDARVVSDDAISTRAIAIMAARRAH